MCGQKFHLTDVSSQGIVTHFIGATGFVSGYLCTVALSQLFGISGFVLFKNNIFFHDFTFITIAPMSGDGILSFFFINSLDLLP